MTNDQQQSKNNKGESLQKRALAFIAESSIDPNQQSGLVIRELIQELSLYQTELEVQNEDLRATQIALEESRSKYAELYNFAPVGYVTLDQHFVITELNLTAESLLGKPRQLLRQRPFITFIRPSHRNQFKEFCSRLKASRISGVTEVVLIKSGAGVSQVILKGIVLGAENSMFQSYYLALIDISELRQTQEKLDYSQRQYQLLFEESNDGIFLCSTDDELLDINPAGVAMLGFPNWSVALRKGSWPLLFQNPEQSELLHRELKAKGHVRDLELRLTRPDGKRIIVQMTAATFSDSVSALSGYRGVLRDVTEERMLESFLLRSQKYKALGVFVSGIAHDFNNILSIILTNSENMQAELRESEAKGEKLKFIEDACLRGKSLVEQIMMYSRGDEEARHPLKLHEVITDSVNFLRVMLPESVAVVAELQPGHETVLANAHKLGQMLLNLCMNASQAMKDGKGTITVKLGTVTLDAEQSKQFGVSEPGLFAKLTVADDGSGMEPSLLSSIFDPFFTTRPNGSGLGLSIVLGIVNSYGGAIMVDSEPGVGSVFDIYLPVIKTGAFATPASEAVSAAKPAPAAHNLHVLLIDDEQALLNALVDALQMLNYRVTACNCGKAALEAFHADQNQFDLVISDLAMPDMRGTELAQQLKNFRSDLPFLLVTGYSNVDSREIAACGFPIHCLMKPFTITELQQALVKILRDVPQKDYPPA